MNVRQRTRINAVLVQLHHHGINVNDLKAQARVFAGPGRNERVGYEKAIDAIVDRHPHLAPALKQTLNQLDRTDDGTVERYDLALSRYIDTGDLAALTPVAATVAQDLIAMAVQNGQISREDAAAGRIDWPALGVSAAGAHAALGLPAPDGPPPPPQQFSFAVSSPTHAAGAEAPKTSQPSPAPNAGTSAEAPAGRQFIRSQEGGIRPAPTGEAAKRAAGTPIGTTLGTRTAEGGYRPPMTGERLARYVGTPLALQGSQTAPE